LGAFGLSRGTKKDTTMKMTKNLIFQGLSTFFEIFMKSLFEVGELFAETKELTKKMPTYLLAI